MWSDRQVERLMCTVIAVCNRAAQRAIGGSDIYMAKWQAEGGVLTGYFMNDVRGMMAEIGEHPAPAAPSEGGDA